MKDRIAVLGAGAIGGGIGAYLAREGYDVTLIDHWPAHIDTIRKQGLKLTDLKGSFTVKAKALHIGELSGIQEPFDMAFLAVKSYDTRWSTYMIEPYLKPAGFIIPAQNGLNDEPVANIIGYQRTIGCVPMISAGIYEPGHVIRTSPLDAHCFTIGELSGAVTPRAQKIAQMLSCIGHSDTTTNIWGLRWSKLVINCMVNALSGIVGPSVSTNASTLPADQKTTNYLIRTITGYEAVNVATTLGFVLGPIYTLPADDFIQATTSDGIMALKNKLEEAMTKRYLDVAKQLGAPDRPSLLQDVIRVRKTEIDYLNGVIVQKGKELGIPTPMNEAIVKVTKEIEAGKAKPGPANLEKFKPYLKP